MTYILVDTANMFFRARHVVRGDSIETKLVWHNQRLVVFKYTETGIAWCFV